MVQALDKGRMVKVANEQLVLQGEDLVEMMVMQHGSGDHFKHIYHRVVVVHTFDPSVQKAKAGGFLEFQDSLGSTEKLCLEENKNNNMPTYLTTLVFRAVEHRAPPQTHQLQSVHLLT